MTKERLEQLTESLRTMTCNEWSRLKVVIDGSFDVKRKEAEKSLCLPSLDELDTINRSRFG